MTRARIPIPLAAVVLGAAACTTASVYQSPVGKFSTAVLTANDVVRPYLLEVNALITRANLYDKVGIDEEWGTKDLKAGIPPEELALRAQALSTIAGYSKALADVAGATSVEQLQAASRAVRAEVGALSITFEELKEKRQTTPADPAASTAAKLDIRGPITALLALFSTVALQEQQKAMIEDAILNGEAPISELIDLLKNDLRALMLVHDTSYASVKTGMVLLYQQARTTAGPREKMSLINELVDHNARIEALRAVRIDALLDEMKSAHASLVAFARSPKTPADLAQLSSRVDVFTSHVRLVRDVLEQVSSMKKHPAQTPDPALCGPNANED